MKTYNVSGAVVIKGRETMPSATFKTFEEAEAFLQRTAFGHSIDLTIYEYDEKKEALEKATYAPREVMTLRTGEYKR